MSGSMLFPRSNSIEDGASPLFGKNPGFPSPAFRSSFLTPGDKGQLTPGGFGFGGGNVIGPPGHTPFPNVNESSLNGGEGSHGVSMDMGGSHRSRQQSIFFSDLSATPASRNLSQAPVGAFSDSPFLGQASAAAAAALWGEALPGTADSPPPPFSTLEDQLDRSPDAASQSDAGKRGAGGSRQLTFGSTPGKPLQTASSAGFGGGGGYTPATPQGAGAYPAYYGNVSSAGFPYTPGLSTSPQVGRSNPWLGEGVGSLPRNLSKSPSLQWAYDSPAVRQGSGKGLGLGAGERSFDDRPSGVGADGTSLLQQGLLTLTAPDDVVRPPPSHQEANSMPGGREQWVVVFGFGAEETNLVLREFEKCGPIIDHVSGPGASNWIYIQYQSLYDAQRALAKNGLQLSRSLLVGVKPPDAAQFAALVASRAEGNPDKTIFRVSGRASAPKAKDSLTPVLQAARPYYLQAQGGGGATGAGIAQPAKSTIGKLVDYVFGV